MAVVSTTDIANLALSHLHDKAQVENVETEQAPEAQSARLWLPAARRQALVEYNPDFAKKRVTLQEHAVDPPSTWQYRYNFPVDCVQPRRIPNPFGRDQTPMQFDVEVASDDTRSILTNAKDAVLIYTRDVTDPTHYTPQFVLALSYLLAHYMCGPITGKSKMKTDLLQAYNLMLNTGGATEANHTVAGSQGWPMAPWHQARQSNTPDDDTSLL